MQLKTKVIMETLKLNNANLVELTNDELVNIDGGVVVWLAIIVVVALMHTCTGDSASPG